MSLKTLLKKFMPKKQRVLFLGAGASHNACYPLTANIFDELENFYKNYKINNYSELWRTLNQSLKNFPDDLNILIKSENPEIILTLPDLLEEGKQEYENALINQADKSLFQKNESLTKKIIHNLLKLYEKNPTIDARKIKNDFTTLLGHYFLMRHCDDRDRILPAYLEKMFLSFDRVITTNWDTLAERILLNKNKWYPTDGYGFPVSLEEDFGITNQNKKITYPISEVKVLKLHGSVGWHEKQKMFYLSQYNYLQYLIPNVRDEKAPKRGSGPDEDPVLLYPSFLKQLDNPTLLTVWENAQYAIEHASSITVVGYSLPKADVAIRALLLPMRTNSATIKIVDPCSKESDTRKRWIDFFASSNKSPEFNTQEAAQYFSNNDLLS